MQPLIQAHDLLWQVSGKTIINVKDFSLNHGENLALIGKNGSGKSSLVKLLALLQKPCSGTVAYDGSPCSTSSLDIRRKISLVFQEPLLLRGSVNDNVTLGLKIRGVPQRQIIERVEYWLELFGITHLARQNVRGLSGGESQRVSLARALVTEPELLILDEPFSALDTPSRAGLMQDFCDILKNSRLATIFITHNITEIPIIAERVCVIEQGSILEDGSPQKVLNYPDTDITASLVGIENSLPGEVIEVNGKNLVVKCEPLGNLIVKNTYCFQRGMSVKILIKPNLIRIGKQKDYNSYTFIVDKISPLHYVYRLTGETHNLIVIVSKEAFAKYQLGQGKQTDIFIPEEAIHLIRAY
jgi:tungstate transport system ATP-binding protein